MNCYICYKPLVQDDRVMEFRNGGWDVKEGFIPESDEGIAHQGCLDKFPDLLIAHHKPTP